MADRSHTRKAGSDETEQLRQQVECLRAELEDAQETLRAIREGEVDALVVETLQGEQVFTLQGADQAYRALIEQMQEGAVTLVEDGSIHYSNRRFAEIIGRPLEAVVGSSILDYVVQRDRDQLAELIHRAFEAGSAHGEVSLQGGSGRRVAVYLGLSAITVNNASSICMVVTDLTEQKRAEEILASDRHARAILNQALDAIVVFDSQGRLTFANAAARKLARLDPADTNVGFVSGIWGKRYCPDGQPIAPEDTWLARALRGEETLGREARMVRADGSYYDILINASPLRDFEGRIIGAVGTFDDITERNRSAEAIMRSARRRELLAQASARVMAQTGREDLLKTAVNAARELTEAHLGVAGHGYTEGKFFMVAEPAAESAALGSFAETLKVDRGGVYLDLIQRSESIRLDDQQLRSHPAWWGLPDGHLPLRGLLGARLVDAHGQPSGILMVSDKHRGDEFTEEDEALLKQLAVITSLALQHIEARNAAEAANRAKSQFLANMSHELRTPMNAVLGMTDLAIAETTSSTVRDYLDTVKESAGFLLELLDQVLDFSRIEAGRFELESAPFRLRRVLGQVCKALSIRAQEKGLELACEVEDGVPDIVVGDSLRLRQVLNNLIGNAIKFTSKGEIVVRVRREEPSADRREAGAGEDSGPSRDSTVLEFSVADTGIGISSEQQEKVFAPFIQADASTTRHYGGSGLGLAISSSLVGLMGGRMRVESQPGQGSTFFFTARLGLEAGDTEAADAAMDWAALRDLPVLVVTDNPTSRRILEHVLTSWSMHPTMAVDVPSALAKVHEAVAAGQPFRLVLADALMPGISGYTLAGWLSGQTNLAGRVILMVSGTDRQHPQDVRELGAMCLEKPVSQSDLLNAIAQALGARRSETLPEAADQGAHARPPARLLRVLLAEDTPANQKLAVHVLNRRGHEVVVAQNGQQAIDLLQLEPFDVVLMDVQMPLMDGFQATAAIRKLAEPKARVPICAMTAHALKGDADRCLAAGMDAYLSKPIKGDELIDVVERLAEVGGRSEPSAAADVAQYESTETAAQAFEPPSDEASPSEFNLEEAVSRCFGKYHLFQDMVDCFYQESPDLLERIEQALNAGEPEEAARLAHRLRNTVAYLGSGSATQAVRCLETVARAGQLQAAAESLRELIDHCRALQESLQSHRGAKAG